MEELTELKSSETILVPPDEIIKLQLLQMAIDSRNINPLEFAKEMYEWVKAGSQHAEKWNSQTGESKYTYDLTGCVGYKTGVANEPKQ